MALIFPTPSELRDQYLTVLKSLKPEVDVKKTDSDWYVRGAVVGGILSGVYADQRKIADDAFPQSARREALEKHLITYFKEGFIQPQQSHGELLVSGTIGTVIPELTEFVYEPTGHTYQSLEEVTLTGATGIVPIQSVDTGQDQNLLEGAALVCSTPPSGLDSEAIASTPISDGRDVETNEEAAARILAFIRQPPAGGTSTDYERFAREGSDAVVDATVIRFLNGLGTLGIIVTAGTTDIDGALDSGVPVVRQPSNDLLEQVQAYVDVVKVETDCVTISGPNVIDLDVTVRVRFVSGNLATVEPNTGLTYEELVQREVKRAIYKTPPGGRKFGGSGYVVCSEIEEVIDAGLSALPYAAGSYAQILADRQVDNLDGASANLLLGPADMAEPGTITVLEM